MNTEEQNASPTGEGDGNPEVIPMAVADYLRNEADGWQQCSALFFRHDDRTSGHRCIARAEVLRRLAEKAEREAWTANTKPSERLG